MVFLDLTDETGGNANGVGLADVVTERLASKIDRLAMAAALEMCAGVSQRDARFVRVRNTLKLRRIYASESLLPEVEKNERLHIVEEARSMRFGDDGALV